MKYLLILTLFSLSAFGDTRVDSTMQPCPLSDSNYVAVPDMTASTRLDIASRKLRDSDLPDGIYHWVCDYKLTKYNTDPVDPNEPVVVPPDPNEPPPTDPNEPAPTDPNEPVPDPNEPTVPPVVEGPMDARFAALLQSPNLHDFLAMNKVSEVCENTRPCVNKGLQNPMVHYDPEENAFRVDIPGDKLSSQWQIRRYFPNLDHRNADMVSFQWEFKFNEAFNNTGGIQNYKAFQLASSAESLTWELQTRFGLTDSSAVAVPTLRYYRDYSRSEANDKDPISSSGTPISRVNGLPIDNWQPGGQTNVDQREDNFGPYTAADHLNPVRHSPYIIRANIWTRVTVEFDFSGNEYRMKVWMSDEETPPTLIIASVREEKLTGDKTKGFVMSDNTDLSTIYLQNWWIELNTSQTSTLPTPGKVWVKNFVVYKNAQIPLD